MRRLSILILAMIAGVACAAPPELARAVAIIDREVANELREKQVLPNPRVDDGTFVRRLYLDVIGRIPTRAETNRFLDAKEPNKRAKLIDQLLNSPGYVSRQYNHWADVLRIQSKVQGIAGPGGQPYSDWVKKTIADNKPYDQFVRELLTANGTLWEPEDGAIGYYLRDRGMPLDNLSNTMQIFAGTQMQCAQCHDHPSDKWTQRQFFELAAFTDFGRLQPGRPGQDNPLTEMRRQMIRKKGRDGARPQGNQRFAAKALRDLLGMEVAGKGTGTIQLPKDYQYDDGKPGERIIAKTPFGEEIALTSFTSNKKKTHRLVQTESDSRVVFANWLTSPENPRFTKVIANRMFKQALGWGLIEPVDDLRDDTKASLPKTQYFLERLMIAHNYDLKAFLRVIYNTRLYQSEAAFVDPDVDLAGPHGGPILRRMNAEQLWDSMLTLAFDDVDERQNPRLEIGAQNMYNAYDRLSQMSGAELSAKISAVDQTGSMNPREVRRQFAEMTGMSSDDNTQSMMQDAIRKRFDSPERRQLMQKMKAARKAGDFAKMRELRSEFQRLQKSQRYNKAEFVRASELPSPPPNGHFLRRFGASDREQIEGSDSSPSVTQSLTMMNGWIDEMLLPNPKTAVRQEADAAKTVAAKTIAIYETILSRRPQEHELARAGVLAAEAGDEFTSDLIWALANSNEFLFVR